MIAAGIATVLLFIAMGPAEQTMQDNGSGMVPFELTGGQERSDEIMDEWGEEGQDAARQQLWIDFPFLLAYGTLLTLLLAATRDLALERGWRRLSSIGRFAITFGALSAGFDALENICLLITLDGGGAAFPVLATIFATIKFALLGAAILYLLAGLAMRLRPRDPVTP